jgi:hypothetical protein
MKPFTLLGLVIVATVTAAPRVALHPNDIVGDWISLRGCSQSLYKFKPDGKYRGYCFDTVEAGRWSLRGENKIMITHYDDPIKERLSAKSRQDILTITGFERHSDRTFMYVRFHGRPDKWMK